MAAQELRDLRSARDDLERRVHDLKLTRQVTMQSLPSIRLVQENDKSLVTKINSTLVNTVPLWETQLAQAVTIQRSSEAAGAIGDAHDLTNELLTANAETLRESNRRIREEMERGVFDIEAVKQANADLVGTIEESLAIAEEGKRSGRRRRVRPQEDGVGPARHAGLGQGAARRRRRGRTPPRTARGKRMHGPALPWPSGHLPALGLPDAGRMCEIGAPDTQRAPRRRRPGPPPEATETPSAG